MKNLRQYTIIGTIYLILSGNLSSGGNQSGLLPRFPVSEKDQTFTAIPVLTSITPYYASYLNSCGQSLDPYRVHLTVLDAPTTHNAISTNKITNNGVSNTN